MKLDELFHAARAMPEAEWETFAVRECSGDDALAQTLLGMLRKAPDAFAWFEQAESSLGLFWEEVAPVMVGPYRVLRILGRGGMGTVYLAVREGEEFLQTVAVKCMRREGEEVLRRFLAERRILSRLEHPGIARLLDGGRTEHGEPYLVMEYVAGEPLTAWMRRGPSILDRLRLFRAVGEAVAYAHRNLVVHRDLKPSNILVPPDGQPKLLDFGIAKLLDESGETGPGPLTPHYAAPEQLTGGPITTLTDVYGLGALLFELLTGRRSDDPWPPPGVDRELGQIACKAMEANPADRYQSVTELLEDLRAYESGRPVHAHGYGWLYRSSKYLRRHWIGVGFAAVILIGAVSIGMQSWRLEQERERARLVSHLVPELFTGVDVLAALERNLPGLRARYAAEPLVLAELLSAAAHACQRAGHRERALLLFREALDLRRGALGPTHPMVVETKAHLEAAR